MILLLALACATSEPAPAPYSAWGITVQTPTGGSCRKARPTGSDGPYPESVAAGIVARPGEKWMTVRCGGGKDDISLGAGWTRLDVGNIEQRLQADIELSRMYSSQGGPRTSTCSLDGRPGTRVRQSIALGGNPAVRDLCVVTADGQTFFAAAIAAEGTLPESHPWLDSVRFDDLE